MHDYRVTLKLARVGPDGVQCVRSAAERSCRSAPLTPLSLLYTEPVPVAMETVSLLVLGGLGILVLVD